MKQNLTNEQKQATLAERLKNFRLLDDDYMTKFFEDNIPCTELLIHIVMDRSDLAVSEVRTQYFIKNLQGRSIKLDIMAEDGTGKKYNFEIQRADRGAGTKRARYHAGILDANAILPGDDFEKLPETYVIFITENDIFGKGKPIYHIQRRVQETGEIFQDGLYIIYVNGEHKDESPLGKLMQDFACSDPDGMNYPLLADRARYFKESKEGRKEMSRIMEEIVREEIRERNIEIASVLLKIGKLTLQEIAESSGLTLEEIEEMSKLQPV